MWSPRRLADVAIRSSIVAAVAVWVPTTTLIAASLLFVISLPLGEPYPDIVTAMLPDPTRLPRFLLVLAGLATAVAALMIVASRPRSLRQRAGERAILLSPMICLLPIMAWAPFALMTM